MATAATKSTIGLVTACPSCGGSGYADTGPESPGFKVVAAGREFHQPAYSIRECSTCGLLYKNSTASPAELDEYYARVDFRKWEVSGQFPTERAALAILRTMPRGSRFLDFGCSSGRLLAPMLPDYDCFGFEINVPAALLAADKGIKMLSADFLECGTATNFDAVVLVDVFEHLPSPTNLLTNLYKLLKPGGLLLIVTGNGDAPPCRLDPAQFWYFRNLEHLCMLTRRNAEFLASKMSATLERWEKVTHYDASLLGYLRQAAQHFLFWRVHRRSKRASLLLSKIPILKRVCTWKVAPGYSCSRDHVVAVFKKPNV